MNYKCENDFKFICMDNEYDEKQLTIGTRPFILEEFMVLYSQFMELVQNDQFDKEILHLIFQCLYHTSDFSVEEIIDKSEYLWCFVSSLIEQNDQNIVELLYELSKKCKLSYRLFKYTGIRDRLLLFTPPNECTQNFHKAIYCAFKHIDEYDEGLLASLQSLIFEFTAEDVDDTNWRLEGYSQALYYLSKIYKEQNIEPLLVMEQCLLQNNIFSVIQAFHSLLMVSEKNLYNLSTCEIMGFIISSIERIPENYLCVALECIFKASSLSNISDFIQSTLVPDAFLNLMDKYNPNDGIIPNEIKEYHSQIFQNCLAIICNLYCQEIFFHKFHNGVVEETIFNCITEQNNKNKEIAALSIFNSFQYYSSYDYDSFVEKGIMDELIENIDKGETVLCTLCIRFLLESVKKSEKCRDFVKEYFEILQELYDKSTEADGNQSLYASLYFLIGFYQDLELSEE